MGNKEGPAPVGINESEVGVSSQGNFRKDQNQQNLKSAYDGGDFHTSQGFYMRPAFL